MQGKVRAALCNLPLGQAAALVRAPEHFFAARARAFGDPFPVNLPGAAPLWLTGSPDGARCLFAAPPDTFDPPRPNPVEPLLGPGSLILLSGERHRRERKLLSTPFRGRSPYGHAEAIVSLVLEPLSELPVGTGFVAQELARRITLRVIIEVVFGIRDAARRARFEEAIHDMLGRYLAPLMIAPGLRRGLWGLSPWDRFVQARARFRALLHGELTWRRTSPTQSEGVLGALLGLRYEDGSSPRDEHLVDELCTLLVAGHDTTAIGLSWALYYVHRDARVRTRLQDELESLGPQPCAQALLGAPYLRAVCEEALRIHPVVPISVRRLRGPWLFRDRQLAPGDSVGVALTLLHRDPALYERPSEFMPERFFTRQHSPFEYAPFGGGARRCLGASFALMEMQLVLGTLLGRARFHAQTASPTSPALHGITMGPTKPIFLRRLS